MFMRTPPTETLETVREKIEVPAETVTCINTQVDLDLVSTTPTVRFGDQTTFEQPAGSSTVDALGSWLEVPASFLRRLDPELQQNLLMGLLRQAPGTMLIRFNDTGIVEVRDPSTRVIDPRKMVDVAARVIDPQAPVVDFWSENEFRLDVMVPTGFERGWGGDPAEGDITGGGIRLFQDRKHNLAPSVAPFLYRLACTNGMEMEDDGLKVDARGQTVEQVLDELEEAAQRAFARVEDNIASFYDMRTQRVENPERALLRMAEERGLPSRTAMAMAQRIPAMTADDGSATMFDLVNLVTNQANDPLIRGRTGVRRTLEATGGSIVTEHTERCGHCQTKLSG